MDDGEKGAAKHEFHESMASLGWSGDRGRPGRGASKMGQDGQRGAGTWEMWHNPRTSQKKRKAEQMEVAQEQN